MCLHRLTTMQCQPILIRDVDKMHAHISQIRHAPQIKLKLKDLVSGPPVRDSLIVWIWQFRRHAPYLRHPVIICTRPVSFREDAGVTEVNLDIELFRDYLTLCLVDNRRHLDPADDTIDIFVCVNGSECVEVGASSERSDDRVAFFDIFDTDANMARGV